VGVSTAEDDEDGEAGGGAVVVAAFATPAPIPAKAKIPNAEPAIFFFTSMSCPSAKHQPVRSVGDHSARGLL